MGVIAHFSRSALDAVKALARESGEEICGLLLGASEHVDAILPAANVAADRMRHFEIDPAILIAAHRAQRGGGPRILGCYHSHPGGDARPSVEDAAQAEANGWLWLICAGEEATLWRAVADGAVHGRFDPVEMS